jgi:hypothetical protein
MARVISPAVQALATESGQLQCHLDVVSADGMERILSTKPSPGRPATLRVVDGKVTTDSARSIPGQGDFRVLVTDDDAIDLIPRVARHPLSPVADTWVQVSYGAPGDPEETHTPYGRYEIANLTTEQTGEGVVLDGEMYDGSRKIERAQFFHPWWIFQGMNYADAIVNLLENVLPGVEFKITPTKLKTSHLTWDVQDDRLQAVLEMCTALGYRFSWDGVGNPVFAPDSEDDDDPIWEFVDGGNATVTKAKRALSDEKAYNGVIVQGEATGSDKPPVRGEAWDLDPDSPTYFDPADPTASTYGPIPFFMVTQFVTTTKQAIWTARAKLPKVMGATERLHISAVANPGVQDGDPIRVEAPRIGVTGTFVVESTTMPFKAGLMDINCRERRLLV